MFGVSNVFDFVRCSYLFVFVFVPSRFVFVFVFGLTRKAPNDLAETAEEQEEANLNERE